MLALLFMACHPESTITPELKGDDIPEDSDVTLPDTGEPPPPPATIDGTVEVTLYDLDEEGNRVEMAWPSQLRDFPFGQILVGTYVISGDALSYPAETLVRIPTIGRNPFHLEVPVQEATGMGVYSVLDYENDTILSPNEPTGLGPADLVLAPGDAVTDVIVIIEARWDPSFLPVDGPGSGGGLGRVDIPQEEDTTSDGVILGGNNSNLDDGVEVSGTIYVDGEVPNGRVAVMLYDADGHGPDVVEWSLMSAVDGGGVGSYQTLVPNSYGEGSLRAAWDSNRNGLIDPADQWGCWSDGQQDLNPFMINETSLGTMDGGALANPMDIYIPIGESLTTVPFISLSGTIISPDNFLTSSGVVWSKVHVAALKGRPPDDFSLTDLMDAYDYQTFDSADMLAGTMDFSLVVPSNTYTYLVAYGDVDGDDLLQEVDEPVSYYNQGSAFDTGGSSISGINLQLQQFTQGP